MKTSTICLQVIFIYCCIVAINARNYVYRTANCGYKSCHPTKPGMLNVHIVCHTHLDTGWVETYEEYYHRYVRGIYDSVINTLFDKPDRKFMVVEVSFFSKWFNEQQDVVKNRVHWLVRTGQLEFINGGWSMNDEAAAYYHDIIDQLTLGAQWLNETFGECGIPRVGWQIDPFGHSREQASIFSQMAFDGMFLGRIDYQDKLLRERTRTLEMLWQASPSLGPTADIFTGVLPNVYWPPSGFCYDVNCFDDQLHEMNQVQKARQFVRHVRQQASQYASNHTIITMGMDFYFRDAKKWYKNLDKLIEAVNALPGEGVHMIYSTPQCYLKSLHESRRQWPVKLDDFFPYADAHNTYWTGYFTSRPSLKYNIRQSSNLLQVAKQLHVLADMDETQMHKLKPLKGAMGILQHHDAVTGTCKQYVNNDYVNMLTKASLVAEEAISDSIERISFQQGFGPIGGIRYCSQLNISSCDITEMLDPLADVIVIIYNPIAHAVKHYVRLPIRGLGYRVKESVGTSLPSQIVPNHEAVKELPGKTRSPADAELVFRTVLPPLGFTSVSIERIEQNFHHEPHQASRVLDGSMLAGEAAIITNGRISATFDVNSGLSTCYITL